MLLPGTAVLFSSPRTGCKFVFFAWGRRGWGWGRWGEERGHGGFGGLCFFTRELLLCLSEQDLPPGSTTPSELTLERLLCWEELGDRPGSWM